ASTGDAGPCTVIGRASGTGAAAAAQANGGASTVLQLQDGHRIARGHPASHIVPAVLAMSEVQGADGEAFLSAFVAGYEASVRIGIALGGLRPELHDAGTWGTLGAAVGATLLLTSDARVVAQAIDGAACVAMQPWSQTAPQGASVHHLYIGLAASMGISAAQGAVAGLTAIGGTIEAFFGPRAGAAFDASRLTDSVTNGRWAHYELMHAYLKVHPTCAHQHGVNDAVQHLIERHGVRGDDVATVQIDTYAHGLAYDNHAPRTELAARFSASYTTAIALQRGRLGADGITEAALSDAAVQSLVARTEVRHDPALDAHYPAGRPARVTFRLRDGRVLQETCLYPRGDSTNPSTRAERRAKATGLLALRLGAAGAARVTTAFDALLAGGPLSALCQALRHAGADAAQMSH
ncbi:MAG: hypothetical protein EOP93_12415, partial [Lysobacteraceae bacterium]